MYASNTTVPIDRSQGEIRKILSKYKATGFAFAESNDLAMVMFELEGRRIKFTIPVPTPAYNSSQVANSKYDQMHRSRWRALVLCIKAKLECVSSGITTLEQEFLSHIVLPNGQTVGEILIPQIDQTYRSNEMPPLLGPGSSYMPSPL